MSDFILSMVILGLKSRKSNNIPIVNVIIINEKVHLKTAFFLGKRGVLKHFFI